MISVMDVNAEINYPTASPAQTFALAVDEAFRSAVCEATRALSHDVSIETHEDGGATVTVDRTVPADVPDFARKFVGETIGIRQTETWTPPRADGGRTADILVEIKGQPAKMTGSIVLEADGEGSRQRFHGDLKVNVPFLGKMLEPEVAKGILASLRQEEKTGRAWLARG